MGRVIHTDSPGKQRMEFLRAMSLAIRELEKTPMNSVNSRDLVAFIIITIDAINKTIDYTVQAWEKRGYWLKADRFRLEWYWVESTGVTLRKALYGEDWNSITSAIEIIKQNIRHVKVSQNHRLGTPWVGAWEKLDSR